MNCTDPVKFITAAGTYLYFRLEARPRVKADFLGVYAYLDYSHPLQGKSRISKETQKLLFNALWSESGRAQ